MGISMELTTWITSRNRIESANQPMAFGVATPLSIAGLLFVGLGQEGQPTETTSLHNRQVELIRLIVDNPLALLLHQQTQTQIVQLSHRHGVTGRTLAAAGDLQSTPPEEEGMVRVAVKDSGLQAVTQLPG